MDLQRRPCYSGQSSRHNTIRCPRLFERAATVRLTPCDSRIRGQSIMGTTTSYLRPDGKKVDGYVAASQGAPNAPGIVIIQEWWGLNDQIRGVAERLATAGYRAVVPDLYRG